jgi:hypothetical protein
MEEWYVCDRINRNSHSSKTHISRFTCIDLQVCTMYVNFLPPTSGVRKADKMTSNYINLMRNIFKEYLGGDPQLRKNTAERCPRMI